MAIETIKLGGFVEEEVAKINANFSEIPTKTSDLTNDSGFITSSAIPTVPTKTSDLTNDSGFITSNAIPSNVSAFTNDAGYITSSAIPTKLSEFTNDANYVKSTDTVLTNKVDKVAGMGLSENNYTGAEKTKLASLTAPTQITFSASDFGSADANGYVTATKTITSGTPIAVFRTNGSVYERVIAGIEIQGGNVVITASEAFAGYVLSV